MREIAEARAPGRINKPRKALSVHEKIERALAREEARQTKQQKTMDRYVKLELDRAAHRKRNNT